MNNPTPDIALQNLTKVAELYSCDGPTRDILRASVAVLELVVKKHLESTGKTDAPATS
jgi:hypothetical protein